MTRIYMQEDNSGNLVDVKVFCGWLCANDYASRENVDVTDWPCYEPSSDAYCAECGAFVRHGVNE